MSATLNPFIPAAPDQVPAAIAPHLLHSPAHSPAVDLQHFMNAYRDAAADSPNSLCYPSSPDSDSNNPEPEQIVAPRGMLLVHSYGPDSAPPGSALTAQIDFFNYSRTNVRLRIVFGDYALPTSVAPNVPLHERKPGQERGDWTLRVSVPPFGKASEDVAELRSDGRVDWPLKLQALDSGGNVLETVHFGFFSYQNPAAVPTPPAPSTYKPRARSPNKRSHEDDGDDEYSPPTPTKRLAMDADEMHLHRMSRMSVDNSFVGSQQGPTAHRPFLNVPSSVSPQNLHAGMSVPSQAFQHNFQSQGLAHPQLQSQTHSQNMPEVFAVPSSPGAHSDESPALVRTTQLGHDAKPEQASISIQGDLEAMKQGWLDNEYMAGRRLVQCWKRQIGTTLHISFGPISQNEYRENTIVVSCIYRDELEDYFITSVDFIYLLEALSGTRFEVEEKNRIRRNIEGFKPMTLSKGKPGTEEFFKAIMEFPPPRPRNIEKNVKVFEWGKLKMMLEKVFSKYSTVPLSRNTPSPSHDGSSSVPSNGQSSMFNLHPRTPPGSSAEPPRLPIAPANPRPRSQKRRSPVPGARLRDVPQLPQLHPSIQTQSARTVYDHLLPTRYNGYDEGLAVGEYAYSGTPLLSLPPLDLDQTILNGKADPAFSGGQAALPAIGVAHHDGFGHSGFRSTSPVSCDDSPSSVALSISSGNSSDKENQDLAGVVPVISDPESLQRPLERL